MKWTTLEVRYLEEHAGEGVEAVALALGRSVGAVEHQARRYGVSLRPRQLCPHCGRVTFRPLSSKTGWCSVCTKDARRERIAEEVRAMEDEARREEWQDRERQRLYARKCRAKKKLSELSEARCA